MGKYTKIAAFALVLVTLFAMANATRVLLDAYDDCYNGWAVWKAGGCRGAYTCNGYAYECSGRYWDGRRWWGVGERGGFCAGPGCPG
ncbi:hypothetical protein WJX75_007783 [Coccomyxa subellipsoidea]|uniref:Chitin-binding type-1 domain-containing protein n=1 Tax=Coccomyxa subellipsoidea TaxID=248742 RepID=A0ABR2YU86_9CHLO